MLMQVTDIQLLLNGICMFSSGFFFSVSQFFKIKYSGPIALCLFCITSVHAIADTIVILYFVKPYRVFCLKLISKIFPMLNINRNLPSVQPSQQSNHQNYRRAISPVSMPQTSVIPVNMRCWKLKLYRVGPKNGIFLFFGIRKCIVIKNIPIG